MGKAITLLSAVPFTGTHTGDFAGIKATGKRITVEGVKIAKKKMRKFIAERDYADDVD